MGMLIHAHLENMDKGVDKKKSAPEPKEVKVEEEKVVEKTTKKRK